MGADGRASAVGDLTVIDLYKILGVRRTAPHKDIHKAYRKKAKSAHPDGGGSDEAFNQLVVAYSVLSDQSRRARYDETGEIELPQPNNLDGGAIEIVAEKLGLVIHAEQDLAAMDVGALIDRQSATISATGRPAWPISSVPRRGLPGCARGPSERPKARAT